MALASQPERTFRRSRSRRTTGSDPPREPQAQRRSRAQTRRNRWDAAQPGASVQGTMAGGGRRSFAYCPAALARDTDRAGPSASATCSGRHKDQRRRRLDDAHKETLIHWGYRLTTLCGKKEKQPPHSSASRAASLEEIP